MNKPNMKWNKSTKTADIRKIILICFSLFIEMETGSKLWTETWQGLNLIKHSPFFILCFKVYK